MFTKRTRGCCAVIWSNWVRAVQTVALIAVTIVATGLRTVVAADYGERLRFYRWAEDYRTWSGDEPGLGRYKHIALSDAPYPFLTIGGDYRARHEYYSNQNFGLSGDFSTNSTLHRFMLHGDLQFESARTFVQLAQYEEHGQRGGPGLLDESEIDLQQAFVDWTPDWGRIRVGRQEIVLGSGLKTGIREGPNQRRAFDGVRATIHDVDVFYAREVRPKRDAFADTSRDGTQFYGIYANELVSWQNDSHLDTFYFGYERDEGVFNQGTGKEHRQSIGARWWKKEGPLQFSYETTYQFGGFADDDISAWGLATETSIGLDHAWSPRFGIRLNWASGDSNPDDDKLGTYNALFPNAAYVSEAAIFAPGNDRDIQPYVRFSPVENLTLFVAVDFLRRLKDGDGIYTIPGAPLISNDVSDAKQVATLFNLTAIWIPLPFVTVEGFYVNGQARDFVADAGGEDTQFLAVSIRVRF